MLGMSSSQLTDFHIFQRGRAQPPSSKHTNTLDFCCCVWNFSGRRGWRLTAKGPGSTWFHPISTVEPDFIFVLYTEALLLRSLIREPITLCLVCFVFVCLRFFLCVKFIPMCVDSDIWIMISCTVTSCLFEYVWFLSTLEGVGIKCMLDTKVEGLEYDSFTLGCWSGRNSWVNLKDHPSDHI